jgi:hypothetical protein
MTRCISALAFLLSLLCWSRFAPAQSASFSGATTDTSPAVLPHVKITARNVESNLARSTVTHVSGIYGITDVGTGLPGLGLGSQQAVAASQQVSDDNSAGKIGGTVMDPTGAVVPGATVRLTEDQTITREASSDNDGRFTFADVTPGSYQLTITSAGFAAETFSGVMRPGEVQEVPPIVLRVAAAYTTVQVGIPQTDVAEQQIKAEEKQRVLKMIPDFYVSFVPNAAPLNFKQKFELAWKTAADPFTFILAGGIAGLQQAQNYFGGYGQEIGGYGKRYGANYANLVTSTFIGDELLASVFKQDPRYFYKGTGSRESRAFYAIANAVICKGDNGQWQPNYSRVLGHLAAGGISNLYYPVNNRHGATLTFENAAVGIGGSAVANVFQEFVVRKFILKAHKEDSIGPRALLTAE